jgi:hypothetical protein
LWDDPFNIVMKDGQRWKITCHVYGNQDFEISGASDGRITPTVLVGIRTRAFVACGIELEQNGPRLGSTVQEHRLLLFVLTWHV